jgi:hypothetical protein
MKLQREWVRIVIHSISTWNCAPDRPGAFIFKTKTSDTGAQKLDTVALSLYEKYKQSLVL